MRKIFTGINIQWPISELILSGLKCVETRTYPIPTKYVDQEMLIIETPGKKGKFKARVVGIVKFKNSFKYRSKNEFQKDYDRHKVEKDSIWDWTDKEKWGWEIEFVKKITPFELKKTKGIIFTKDIVIPAN